MPRTTTSLLLALLPLAALAADPPGKDAYGDPLPPGAVSRIGTSRFTVASTGYGQTSEHAFPLPDGKGMLLLVGRELCTVSTESGRVTNRWTVEPPENSYQIRLLGLTAGGKALVGYEHGVQTYDTDGKLEATHILPGRVVPDKNAPEPKGKRLPNLLTSLAAGGSLAASWHETNRYGDEPSDPLAVTMWSPADGKKVGAVTTPLDVIAECRLSADGKRLALTGERKPPKGKEEKDFDRLSGWFLAFDVGTGKELCRVRVAGGAYSSVRSIAVTADGSKVYTTDSESGAVREWDGATGKPLRRFLASWPVDTLRLSADGKTLVGAALSSSWGGEEGGLSAWDLASGELVGRYPSAPADAPKGGPVYTTLFSNRLHALSLPSLRPVSKFDSVDPPLHDPQFTPESDALVVTTGRTVGIELVDVRTGAVVQKPFQATTRTHVQVASANGKYGFGGQSGLSRGVLDLTTGKAAFSIPGVKGEPDHSPVFSADGGRLLVTYLGLSEYEMKEPKVVEQVPADIRGGLVRVWDTAKAKVVFDKGFTREKGESAEMMASLSGDGKLVAVVRVPRNDKGERLAFEYSVWDVATGKEKSSRKEEVTPKTRFNSLERFHPIPNGPLFVTAQNSRYRLWDADTDAVVEFEELGRVIYHEANPAVSPDGKLIAFLVQGEAGEEGATGKLALYDSSGKAVGESVEVPLMNRLGKFSPNGKFLVTTSADGTHLVWDVAMIAKK